MNRLGLMLMCWVLSACGGDFASSPLSDASTASGDAGPSVGCSLTLFPPAMAAVGQPVEVTATINGTSFGVQSFSWSVDLNDEIQSITELSDPADRIAFTPAAAGPYRVVASATVDGEECLPAMISIGVIATGARVVNYRMRIVPLGDTPMQDFPVQIYGGANAVLPTSVLLPGTLAAGQILDSAGDGVSAYLRARKLDAGPVADYETFADGNGDFSLRLPEGRFDLLVVPEATSVPSMLFLDRSAAEIGSTLTIAAPTSVAGRVLNAAGLGVPGARLSLVVDGAHTTEAITAADGSFSVLATGATLTGLAVAPPPASGMPSLRSDTLSGQPVDELSTVLIRYADATISAQVDIRTSTGAAAPSAQVEWRASLANAATVQVSSVESIAGTLRVSAIANLTGRVQSQIVARTASFVVHAGNGNEVGIARNVPWASTPLTTLSLAPPVMLPVEVMLEGSPVPSARLRAIPLGVLAPQGGQVVGQSDMSGLGSLALVRGGSYQLVVSHKDAGEQVHMTENVQGLAQIFTMPGALIAQGRLQIGTEVGAGAQVRLFCEDCTGPDAQHVHASAVVDGAGEFRFRVNDPGVDDAL